VKEIISGAIRIFNFGVSAYIIFSFVALGLILGAWCILWSLLSNLSN